MPENHLNNQNFKLFLTDIRQKMISNELAMYKRLRKVHRNNISSSRNLIHYLTLRSHDIRFVQDHLHSIGLSSLASSESHSLSQIGQVLSWLDVDMMDKYPCDYNEAKHIKLRNSEALFGENFHQKPHIMVTLSSLMLERPEIFEFMLKAGMTVARINCAHDNQDVWLELIKQLRAASSTSGKQCKVYMDLSGPKIRVMEVQNKSGEKGLKLKEDKLYTLGSKNSKNKPQILIEPEEILDNLNVDQPIFFDDGKFEAVVTATFRDFVKIKIVRISTKKPFLKQEKGINLPKTSLSLKALTKQDEINLPFISKHADMVGFSFVSSPEDIQLLRDKMATYEKSPKIILKIERLTAVNNLPALLMEGMIDESFGVMIARGDLAVEIGFERLSEIQEQIVWICEAAHVPVIWATQVLESMNKTGYATRSEISDAAHAIKTECVMLNKGKYVVKTIEMLNAILSLQKEHFYKKRYTLRPLNIARNFLSSSVS